MEQNFLSGTSRNVSKIAEQFAKHVNDEEIVEKIQQEDSLGIWETETEIKPLKGMFNSNTGTLFDDTITSFVELGKGVIKNHLPHQSFDAQIGAQLDLVNAKREHTTNGSRTVKNLEQTTVLKENTEHTNVTLKSDEQNTAAATTKNKTKETNEKDKENKTKNSVEKEKVTKNGDTTTTVRTFKDGTKEKVVQTGDKVTVISYDKAGLRINKTITEGKGNNKQETNVEYKNGVADKKTVTKANNKDYEAVTYYDNGKASKKVVKDGTSTTTKCYTYDKSGNMTSAYAEVVNDTTKEKTIKSTVYDGNNKTMTETRPDGKVNTYIYERQDDKSDWSITRKEIQKQGSEDKTICEYSDKSVNKDGTATRSKKITTPSGNVYYDVQTIGTNGKVVKTVRYSDEEHKNLTTVTEAKYNADGYKTKTIKTTPNVQDGTKKQVSTEYNEKTGKPKSCVKSTQDDSGKLIKNEKYTYNDNGAVETYSVMNRYEDNRISTEIQTFRPDGTLEIIENTSQGFKSFMNTKGVVSRMEFRDTSAASVSEHLPQTSVPNSSLPLFNSNDGTFIGIAKYGDDGRLLDINWEAGFGAA